MNSQGFSSVESSCNIEKVLGSRYLHMMNVRGHRTQPHNPFWNVKNEIQDILCTTTRIDNDSLYESETRKIRAERTFCVYERN